MEQDRQTSHHKFKTILESLNSNTARQVLKELDQPNPKVKKNLLYELITEISNLTDLDYIQKQIRDKDDLIQIQIKYIENQKAYAQNLENHQKQHIELLLASMQKSYQDNLIIPQLNQIQQNQNQDPQQFLNFQQQFEELISKIDELNNIIQLQQKQILDQKENEKQLEKQLMEAQFQVQIEYVEFGIEMLKKILNEIKIKYDTQVNTNLNDREYLEKIAQQAEKVIRSSVEFTRQANIITQNSVDNFKIFEKSLQINRAILLIMKQLESFQKSFAKKLEQIQNNNEVQREKLKEQLIMMKQAK